MQSVKLSETSASEAQIAIDPFYSIINNSNNHNNHKSKNNNDSDNNHHKNHKNHNDDKTVN